MVAKHPHVWRADFIGSANAEDVWNDNSDVLVRFEDGREYVATFFTVENLRQLMQKFRESGENSCGLYVWSTHMIVVERLTPEDVERVVEDLLENGEFEAAFSISPEPGEGGKG